MRPKRTISPELLDSAAVLDRFRSHLAIGGADVCWPFTGSRNHHGYGRFVVTKRWQYAHRVAWALEHHANVPEGMRVLHRCDNPPCCNPSHLFLGTQTDNMRDMEAKARHPHPRGVTHGNALLTEADVREIRRRWKNGERPAASIAADFPVTKESVYAIVSYRAWRHIP